jgi:hypothetical protein
LRPRVQIAISSASSTRSVRMLSAARLPRIRLPLLIPHRLLAGFRWRVSCRCWRRSDWTAPRRSARPRNERHEILSPRATCAPQPTPDCSPPTGTGVDLGLAHPRAHRRRAPNTQLRRHRPDRRPLRITMRSRFSNQPHRPLPRLSGIPPPPSLHDSIPSLPRVERTRRRFTRPYNQTRGHRKIVLRRHSRG